MSTTLVVLPSLEEVAERFERDGFVHIPGVLNAEELAALQHDTQFVIESAWDGEKLRPQIDDHDYFVNQLPDTGQNVFNRVQYVFPKDENRSQFALLGHPYLLACAKRLLGEDFFLSAEALVFKMPGNGKEVEIHADCDPFDPNLAETVFNIDVYLDDSNLENGCLWVDPGTHKTANQVEWNQVFRGLDFSEMQPVPVKAGDVIIHNIRLVHGSPRSNGGALRRTIYFEFQSLAQAQKMGGPRPGFPATEEFMRERLRLIPGAILERQNRDYAQGEEVFEYEIPSHAAAKYGAEMPESADEVNLRPALGLSKYI